ncbi:MAG: GatB/YqeY domain-containing protein, partial [Candidatus Curtissbacteria bacterium]|nr:GatB/YqeY domain-containing protein [Candidatus Curtissbacteria bacterium]
KNRDETTVSTLRMVISNLNNARIAKGDSLTDDEVVVEIGRDAKRHKESIEVYMRAGREDLVSKETAELEVLTKYLPQQLSDEELANMVGEAISAVGAVTIADMGRVVKAVMSSAGARADGAKVAELVRLKLASKP